MENETRCKIIKGLFIIAVMLLVSNTVYRYAVSRSGTDSDNNVNRTVESIQKSNESARSEVESGRREIEAAEEHIDRTVNALKRGEEAAQFNTRSTDELQTLIGECRGIVETQRRIIQDVDRANGIRTPEGKNN